MQFFTSGLFWFIEGILACLMVVGLKIWMEDRRNPMSFWKWILFVLWAAFAGFTIAFVGTSVGENEMDAAIRGGVIFGLITVVAAAVLWRLLKVGAKKNSAEP